MTGARRRPARILVVAGVFGLLFVGLAVRAVDLALVRGPAFAALAARQHRERIALVPHRGEIVDRHGEPLAMSVRVPSLYVRPREFAGQEARIDALARALGLPAATVRVGVSHAKPFVWLKRQTSPAVARAVRQLGLRGVGEAEERKRFYPKKALAAHVLGFVGIDSQGLEGLERQLDDVIRGEPRDLQVDRDAHGRRMLTGSRMPRAAKGGRVELTIDVAIQDAVERELALGVARARATAGSAIVLDPHTGELLALANVPTYDPNSPQPTEPGSTFKAMLAAAAIEAGAIGPDDAIFCEEGRLSLGRRTIRDSHPHGWLSFAEVIQYSSNIGVTKVAERLGRDRYWRTLAAFGFGARTGIPLPGEAVGIVRPVESWGRIDLATQSFGQGIAVTPLQLTMAFGAIANGGTLMRPLLVRRVAGRSGRTRAVYAPEAVHRVVGAETAASVTGMLRRVVEERGGTGTAARLDGFPVAGKTGTAQKPDLRAGGYSAERIGSFVGFVPADVPRVVILVMIDEPSTSSYGGVVAAPVFRGIASTVMKQLGVVPAVPAAETLRAAAPSGDPPGVDTPHTPEAGGPHRTPSVVGLSLREALARLQGSGCEVRVTGSGYVREQHPAPGAALAAGTRLALRLDEGAARR